MKKPKKQTQTKQTKKKFNPSEHWKGMPEFHQPAAGPVKQIIVNFACKEDMHKFAKLVGQPITAKTRSLYYPANVEESAIDKRYVDEKEYAAAKKKKQ